MSVALDQLTRADQKAAGSGNFFLEYRCRVSGQWVPSGFARITDDTSELVALIVANSVVVSAPRCLVMEVARKYWHLGRVKDGGAGGTNPTKGVIVPIGELVSELVRAGKRLAGDAS